jgi:predicted nucleic acid-binding protein
VQIVIDANIVISMLISPGKPIDLFFREEIDVLAPELLFKEIEKNKGIILQKTGLSEEEFNTFLGILKTKIRIIPEVEFLSYREKAGEISPDIKDAIYFALALYVHCALWSNEKQLKRQDVIVVYATHELIALFGVNQLMT